MKSKLTKTESLLTSERGGTLLYSGRLSVIYGETEESAISASFIFMASVLGCDKFSLLATKNDFKVFISDFEHTGTFIANYLTNGVGYIIDLAWGNRFRAFGGWQKDLDIRSYIATIKDILEIHNPNLLAINMHKNLAYIAHHERWSEQGKQILHVRDILREIEDLAYKHNCHICLLGAHEYETKVDEMHCKEDYLDLRDELDVVCSEIYEVKKQEQGYVLYQDSCSYAPCIDKIRFKFDDEGILICTT